MSVEQVSNKKLSDKLSDKIIDKLKEEFKCEKNSDLATFLSKDQSKVFSWNNRISTWTKTPELLSATKIKNLLKDAVDAAVKRQREEIFKTLIDPITEYFPIDKGKPIGSKKNHYEIQLGGQEDERPDLRDRLERSKGIYIFYDSSTRAIYVGQTKSNTLWKEIQLAFNRDPAQHQNIYRIDHNGPKTQRGLSEKKVWFNEMARYFSAYDIHRDIIPTFEALFIRAFANSLMNKKMETGNLFNQ